MKLRLAILLFCGLCLATAAIGQPQSAVWTPPATLKGPCPDTVESKTAWFDPSLYLLHSNGLNLGRPLSAPDPEYAESARQAKVQGTVLLAVAINTSGTVDKVKIVCKLEPGLDQKAVEAVSQWRFAPATKDTKPVPVQIEVSVGYRLY